MGRKPDRPPNPSKKHRAAALAIVTSIFAATFLILYRNRGTPISSFGDPVIKDGSFPQDKRDLGVSPSLLGLAQINWDSHHLNVQLNPSTAFRNGTDVIWQIPASPKAVLFIAHGCNGRAANFWDRSPTCPNCVGLPEERLVVLNALHQRFAILTVSSLGRCWSFGKEMNSVKGIIESWAVENGLEKLPLVAMGASSEGYFVSALATKIKFNSIALMIAEGVFDEMDIPDSYPPTIFVHMPKDRAREIMIRVNMDALERKGVEVEEITCMEFPLTANFLSARIPGLDQTLSVHIFEVLRRSDVIDKKGFMRKDGRATQWRQAFKDKDPSLEWADHIQEELNLAYGYHEMTSLKITEILAWFESHLNQ